MFSCCCLLVGLAMFASRCWAERGLVLSVVLSGELAHRLPCLALCCLSLTFQLIGSQWAASRIHSLVSYWKKPSFGLPGSKARDCCVSCASQSSRCHARNSSDGWPELRSQCPSESVLFSGSCCRVPAATFPFSGPFGPQLPCPFESVPLPCSFRRPTAAGSAGFGLTRVLIRR